MSLPPLPFDPSCCLIAGEWLPPQSLEKLELANLIGVGHSMGGHALIGAGATTINPYLIIDCIHQRYQKKLFGKFDFETCIGRFKKSIEKKIGI